MPDQDATPTPVKPIEALKLFNEFQSQSRARMEATLKLVLVISGGMLTLSVGAVLGGSPPNIPADLLPALWWAWGLLFYSIAASLLLMFLMIIATFHMGIRWRKALEGKKESFAFIATWPWLRVINGVIGVSVLCSCVAGIALMAYVALGVAGAPSAAQSVASHAVSSANTPNLRVNRSTQHLRRWVPTALRASAPGYAGH